MKLSQALDLLIYNEEVSHQTINMVPSENYASVLSRIPLLLDVYNRYFSMLNKMRIIGTFAGHKMWLILNLSLQFLY